MSRHRNPHWDSRPCTTWLWSKECSIHVAKDRVWFGDDYTAFESFVTDRSGDKIRVVGVGSVSLPVKRSPNWRKAQAILVLENVLHMPDVPCNIVGEPLSRDYSLVCRSSTHIGPTVLDRNGQPVATFEHSVKTNLCYLRLAGPPVGPLPKPATLNLYRIGSIFLSCWPQSERDRLGVHLNPPPAPLNDVEKAFLKENYGHQFKFLHSHGLSIYKDVDRVKGLSLLRELMASQVAVPDHDVNDNSQVRVEGAARRQEPRAVPMANSNANPRPAGIGKVKVEMAAVRPERPPPLTTNTAPPDHNRVTNIHNVVKVEADADRAADRSLPMITNEASPGHVSRHIHSRPVDENAHWADHMFSTEELAHIRSNWNNSAEYMASQGLEFYRESDRPDAPVLLRLLNHDNRETDTHSEQAEDGVRDDLYEAAMSLLLARMDARQIPRKDLEAAKDLIETHRAAQKTSINSDDSDVTLMPSRPNDFAWDLGTNPFDQAERQFIQKQGFHWQRFMKVYELRPWDQRDCDTARRLIRRKMSRR